MENKVYYGEYSLKHWIDLILKQDIELPPYQRYFVWEDIQVRTLIEAFKEKQFIPSITIGYHKDKNIIIDGQQRLTSILLSYLGIFPNKDKDAKKNSSDTFADENDDNLDDDENNMMEWRFDRLTKKGRSKEEILKNIKDDGYNSLKIEEIDEDFWKDNFLGFSYIVPNETSENEAMKFYSTIFKNINIQGTSLTPQESREALYYINKDYKDFFAPDFCNNIKINNKKIDFVRYLSMLSQYKKNGKADEIASGYFRSKNMENYYEEYIYDVINNNDGKFGKFEELFPALHLDAIEAVKKFSELFTKLNFPKEYTSIIDADMYLFGLIYFALFDKKEFDLNKNVDLNKRIKDKIEKLKKDKRHMKSPNQKKHVSLLISESIDAYREYMKNE